MQQRMKVTRQEATELFQAFVTKAEVTTERKWSKIEDPERNCGNWQLAMWLVAA